MTSYYTLKGSYCLFISFEYVLTSRLVSRAQGAPKSKLYVEVVFGGVTQRTKVTGEDQSLEETLPL